eukprot:m.144903 g.144903  ORF g.144903 m.144903 type:complete len:338 (-) comp16776_c3_seq1:426-1439(-)
MEELLGELRPQEPRRDAMCVGDTIESCRVGDSHSAVGGLVTGSKRGSSHRRELPRAPTTGGETTLRPGGKGPLTVRPADGMEMGADRGGVSLRLPNACSKGSMTAVRRAIGLMGVLPGESCERPCKAAISSAPDAPTAPTAPAAPAAPATTAAAGNGPDKISFDLFRQDSNVSLTDPADQVTILPASVASPETTSQVEVDENAWAALTSVSAAASKPAATSSAASAVDENDSDFARFQRQRAEQEQRQREQEEKRREREAQELARQRERDEAARRQEQERLEEEARRAAEEEDAKANALAERERLREEERRRREQMTGVIDVSRQQEVMADFDFEMS